MSTPQGSPPSAPNALNLYTGRAQTVNVFTPGPDGAWDPSRLALFFDQYDANRVSTDPDKWYVASNGGPMGTLEHFSVTYNTALNTGTSVWARVYNGLNRAPNESYFDGGYLVGDLVTNGDVTTWSWDNRLQNVTCSPAGTSHHVNIYKVRTVIINGRPGAEITRDDSIAFLAVPR